MVGAGKGGLREREVCDLKRVQIERGLPCHGMCWSDVAWPRDHFFVFCGCGVRSLELFNWKFSRVSLGRDTAARLLTALGFVLFFQPGSSAADDIVVPRPQAQPEKTIIHEQYYTHVKTRGLSDLHVVLSAV